jgi:hypothetical protein
MFEGTLIFLYALGFVLAGLFVITWTPLAVHAWWTKRSPEVSWLRILDYAGLTVIVFLTFGLLVRNFMINGVAPPGDILSSAGRLGLPSALTFLVALRLFKWLRTLRRHRPPPPHANPLGQTAGPGPVLSDSHLVPGIHEDNNDPRPLP